MTIATNRVVLNWASRCRPCLPLAYQQNLPWPCFDQGVSRTDTVGIAGDRIRSFIERIEHIEEELKALNEGKKEVFSEAKGEGFDVKVLKEILRLRKQDKDERDEHESLLDLYMKAMETSDKPQAMAA